MTLNSFKKNKKFNVGLVFWKPIDEEIKNASIHQGNIAILPQKCRASLVAK